MRILFNGRELQSRGMKARLTFLLMALVAFPISSIVPASAADTVITSFSVAGAESAVFSLDGSTMWISNCVNNRIEKWTTETPTRLANISILGCAYNLAITPDGSKIVAANNTGQKINIISTSSDTILASLSPTGNPKGVNISPDGAIAWVGTDAGYLHKVNLSTNTITSSTQITGTSDFFQDIAVTADGSTLYVCSYNTSKLYKVRTSDLAIVTNVSLSAPCWYVALSPNEAYAYATFYGQGSMIDRINLSTMTKATSITGGNAPAQGVFSKDGNFFYVSNSGAGNVLKIRTSDNTIAATITGTSGLIWHANLDPQGKYLYAMSAGGTVYKIGADGAIAVATLSISPFSTATYRTSTTLQATVETSGGRATFYQNGKYIPGCQSIVASTTTVSCSYKPTVHGAVQISVKYVLNGSSKTVTSTLPVQVRKTLR